MNARFLVLRMTMVIGLVGASSAYAAEREATSATIDALLEKFEPTDWPWWRGPDRNGISTDGKIPPTTWNESKNVKWKAPIPGRGHGSVTVVGEQVLLATADHEKEIQLVVCLDKETGKEQWRSVVHDGNLEKKGNKKASQASGTIACDGERFFVNFLNDKAAWTTALDRKGGQLWQTKITDYQVHQGYGSSPAIYGPLVIVSADNKQAGAVAGLDRVTGKIVWKKTRPKVPNYSSPVILTVAGKDQLLFTGCNLVSSYDPLTGELNWETKGATTECVTSTVTDGTHIFTSGGYPKNHISAVKADGSGTVAWENKARVYVPSLLCQGGHLFGILDAGVASCWNSSTGEELWKARLGGTFTSSPVMAAGLIYATNESGNTYVFKASAKSFELVDENKLGDHVLATPTICGGRIYYRTAVQIDNVRQEFLYCLGE
jgi:outer membrane protein assembly factor BamB